MFILHHMYFRSTYGHSTKSFSGLGHGVKIFTVNDDYSGESLTNPTTDTKYKKETRECSNRQACKYWSKYYHITKCKN